MVNVSLSLALTFLPDWAMRAAAKRRGANVVRVSAQKLLKGLALFFLTFGFDPVGPSFASADAFQYHFLQEILVLEVQD